MECPDCHKEVDKVIVEAYRLKPFDVDNDRKLLIPQPNHDWDTDEYSVRCGHCESLNINDDFSKYDLEDGMRSLM